MYKSISASISFAICTNPLHWVMSFQNQENEVCILDSLSNTKTTPLIHRLVCDVWKQEIVCAFENFRKSATEQWL